jgi:uncharacterized phage infection (PIP) family protein YhgE
MVRIAPLVITLVLLLATCFFGFQTHSKVQGLNDQVTKAQSDTAMAQQGLTKSKADLKTAQDDDAKAKADAASATSNLTGVQTSLDAATKQVTDLTAQMTTLKAQIAAAPTPGPAQAPAGPSQADLDKANAEVKDGQAQIAELKQVEETLTNKAKDADSRVDDLQKQVDHYKTGTLRNGLVGEVLAYNPGWNFVVLSIGDRQGAVTNAEMILTRGGSQIGKVRITSVEPSTSVADVIPGSLASGVRVQPGDHVIFTGN